MQNAVTGLEMPNMMKTHESLEQDAATTVLTAVWQTFEGKGGIYLDDCQVASLSDPAKDKIYAPGSAVHAPNEEGEKRLWICQCKW